MIFQIELIDGPCDGEKLSFNEPALLIIMPCYGTNDISYNNVAIGRHIYKRREQQNHSYLKYDYVETKWN